MSYRSSPSFASSALSLPSPGNLAAAPPLAAAAASSSSPAVSLFSAGQRAAALPAGHAAAHPSLVALTTLMKRIEYRGVVDKSGWERGPWDDEPDKVQWPDDATGLPCLIVRGPVGALCGYVGVPPGHPWHGADYDAVEPYPRAHGGLTFAGSCAKTEQSRSICHVPGEGEPDDVWWLGFDCAHFGDYTEMSSPAHVRGRFPRRDDVYRDIAYVERAVAELAADAAAAAACPVAA